MFKTAASCQFEFVCVKLKLAQSGVCPFQSPGDSALGMSTLVAASNAITATSVQLFN